MIKILFVCHGSTADSRELAVLVGQNRANHGNRSSGVLRFTTSEETKKSPKFLGSFL